MKNTGCRALNKLKKPYQNIHFGKVFLVLMLISAIVLGSINPVKASSNIKTMTVIIGEGGIDQSQLSKVVNIPNLKSIVKVTSNTGTVTHTVNANNVTLNARDGSPSRTVNNSKKYSKYVKDRTDSDYRDSDGYRGTLTYTHSETIDEGSCYYDPETNQTHCESWSQSYYAGTVYKAGADNYYKYVITIEYVDNTDPTLVISSPAVSQTIRDVGTITISGTVSDPDTNTLTISATMGGRTKSTTVTAPATNKAWSLTWSGSELAEGTYNTIPVTVSDGTAMATANHTGAKIVDKTNPTAPTIIANENWSKDNVVVTITPGTDAGSGVDRTEYSLSGATTKGWTTYTSEITISNEGITTIKARTIDNAENISNEVSKDVKIDKTVPTTPIPVATVDSSTKITVEASPKDLDSGVNSILWNKNGEDLDSWVTENILVDNDLTPNKKYTYKYKATDNVDNMSEYSESVSKYTFALYPIQIKLSDYTSTTVTLDILNNEKNKNIPENKIILREKDTDIIIATSEWTKDETITLTGLEAGKVYEVWLNTRNEDKIENGEVHLPSKDFNIKLVDSEGNEIVDILTNKSPEINILSEIEGKILSESEGFNQIPIKATIKDKDIGDQLKIKYTLSKNGNYINELKEIQLGKDIIADGNLQDFEESIEITSIFPEGEIELSLWAEDNRGGKSELLTYNIVIDKTSPLTPDPIVEVNSQTQITIEASLTDELAGLHQEYILWNRDNIDIDTWTDINPLVDNDLTANKKYTYKYKAKDAVNNISKYSNEVSKYTLALNPIKVMLNDYTSTQAMFTIFNNEGNENIPETQIIIKEKGTDKVIVMSEWSENEEKIINGLEENKRYEVYLNTRNRDNVENGEIKLSSTSEPKLVDYNDDPIDDFIASDEEAAPVITIKPYETEPTNQDITVHATTDKGILNESSHTFIENGSFTFIAKTLLGNITKYVVTIDNIDKNIPIITIEPYETEPTNQDITVHATTDKGILNESSHTFTENGSFTFIATDEAGNIAKETVTITNIDKNLPTEGEIIIIALDEDGRVLQTIEKKNLGFGVQVVQAPVIPGCKLISTPVATLWLKPSDSMKKVKFTYKLDKEWGGWEDAEKAVEKAEKAVEEAEKAPSKETKDEAQKEIDKARDIVDKLPESEKKDELNKKLDELQDRLDKVKIPNYDSESKDDIQKKDKDEDKDKNKIIVPEIRDIPLDKFVARWEGHETLSNEPILVEKAKASFEIEEATMKNLNRKGLTPRIYQWNKNKEKWVALSTKVDKNIVETYEEIEGYVATFAVKQPEFKDIKSTEWYAQTADKANGLALVEGYTLDDGNVVLQPNSAITRSEFYAMTSRLFGGVKEGDNSLYNILNIKSIDESIKVLDETSYISNNWAKPYIASLHEKEIIREVPGYENLNDNITRIEAMDILSKLLKEVEDVEVINLNEFKDFKEVKRYENLLKNNIEIANIVKGYDDKTLRPNNSMTRVEALILIINSLEQLGW